MKPFFAYLQKRPKLSLGLASLWTFLIYVGCSLPGKELPNIHVFNQFDKVVHTIFFLFFFLLWMAYRSKPLWILLSAILFGFGLEFYQHFCVTGRSFDVWDGLADTLGALLGWFLIRMNNKS